MATTLKARAGSALKATFSYVDTGGEVIDVSGYTARLQIREVSDVGRIILETTAPSAELQEDTPSVWKVFLGATLTSMLPSKSRYELELISTTNSEDVITVEVGVILMEPQAVTKVS